MTDTTKKKPRNVAVRVPDELYRSVKRTFADTDETFQSLIVKLLSDYVSKGISTASSSPDVEPPSEFFDRLAPRAKRRFGGK